MKRTLSLIAGLLLFGTATTAQEYGQSHTLKVWDNTTAPHSNGLTDKDQKQQGHWLFATTCTELYIYPADPARATGQAVVICPGGGYKFLSMEQEGFLMGQWFASQGITAAVLHYRMPNGHREVPLEDAQMALRIMAGLEAGATGFTADKVGIVGSSAGGHLAASASTIGEFKPAFAILFYPVITGEAGKCHKGSFDSLLGTDRTDSLTADYSLQNRVSADTPPTMILFSDDDKTVPPVNGTLYYQALKEHGVKASLHIYPSGGHGWGMRDDFKYKAQWQQAVLDFLKGLEE